MKRCWRKGFVSLFFKVLVLLSATQCAQAIEFFPQSCKVKDPEGLTYIALGTTVFRLPIVRMSLTFPPAFDAPRLTAPDPDEPLGCPNNPFQQQNLMFPFGFDVWLKDRPEPSGSLLREISLIASPADYWGIRYEEFYPDYCKLFPRRKKLSNGLSGCLPPENPRLRGGEEVGRYLVDKQVYSAPFDKEFAISCSPDVPDGTKCVLSYKILAEVNIFYAFVTTNLRLEDSIEFDKVLRADVLRAVVPDYKWK
jgi:hypothetical protein